MPVTETLKDAAYVTIGFGVIGFQKAQVRRQELKKQLGSQVAAGRRNVAELASQLDAYVAPVRSQVESRLDDVEGALPVPAQELLKSVRAAWQDQERFLRNRLGLTSAA